MTLKATQLLEAGALCLEGKCPHAKKREKSESTVTAEEVNALLDKLYEEERPSREAKTRAFAGRHGITGVALDELIAWECDGVSPPNG